VFIISWLLLRAIVHRTLYYIPITILDIIHRPVLYLRPDVSKTGFCLRLKVKTILFNLVEQILSHNSYRLNSDKTNKVLLKKLNHVLL
jgi:hypothetical protein